MNRCHTAAVRGLVAADNCGTIAHFPGYRNAGESFTAGIFHLYLGGVLIGAVGNTVIFSDDEIQICD